VLSFPFGEPIRPVCQGDRGPKPVFVLGVYASAVHARWVDDDGSVIVSALAVASEPEIFWRGDGTADIVAGIAVPPGAGRLEPASKTLNGPSGQTLDDAFLRPLLGQHGAIRDQAWLCDLLPESRCNPKQRAALDREYVPRMQRFGLPEFDFPPVPAVLADEARIRAIEQEILAASPAVVITLGDQPLRWFTSHYGSHKTLAAYGETERLYGMLHEVVIGGHRTKLLPLVHPRQAGRLGSHSPKWSALHAYWMQNRAASLMESIPA